MPVSPLISRARSLFDRILSARTPLSGSALLGFTMFALVAVVLPDVWLSWDLPNPQIWTAAFLILLLLHAERPEMPRGAWFELWTAAAVLAVMHLALLVWSRWEPVLRIRPNPVDALPWAVVWACVLAMTGLLVTAAFRYRATTRAVAVVLAILLAALLTGLVHLKDVEAVLGALLCLCAVLLAVRHRRRPEPRAALLLALWPAALLFAVFLVMNHPVAFRFYGLVVMPTTVLVTWGSLGLLTAAVLVRARQITLGAAGGSRAAGPPGLTPGGSPTDR